MQVTGHSTKQRRGGGLICSMPPTVVSNELIMKFLSHDLHSFGID